MKHFAILFLALFFSVTARSDSGGGFFGGGGLLGAGTSGRPSKWTSGTALGDMNACTDSNGNTNYGQTAARTNATTAGGVDVCAYDTCLGGGVGAAPGHTLVNAYDTGTNTTVQKAATTGASLKIESDPASGFYVYKGASTTKDSTITWTQLFQVFLDGHIQALTGVQTTGVTSTGAANNPFTGPVTAGGIASSSYEACAETTSASDTINVASTSCRVEVNSTDTQAVTVNLFNTASCSYAQTIEIHDLKVNAAAHNITINTAVVGDKFYGRVEGAPISGTTSVTLALSGNTAFLRCSGYTGGRWGIYAGN